MYPITHSKLKKKMAEIEYDRQEDCRDICPIPFVLDEKDVTNECLATESVECYNYCLATESVECYGYCLATESVECYNYCLATESVECYNYCLATESVECYNYCLATDSVECYGYCLATESVECCEMGSVSEELIGSWCSCADSSEEVEGEGDRQEDMLRNVESWNLCGNDC